MYLTIKKTTLLFFLFFCVIKSYTQNNDSLKLNSISSDIKQKDSISIKKHSPQKATLLSAVLPGSGQFYNKKYWKMPVVYVGFGTLIYFISTNQSLYKDYKQAIKYRTDDNPETTDKFPQYSVDGLFQAKNYYRRNVELSYIFTAILYTLNVVDAAVDAHLYDFDVSDELSFKIQPALINNPYACNDFTKGFKITFNIKN